MAIDPPRLPTVAVVTIGHYRHGKTTLTAAISKVLAGRAGPPPIAVHELDRRGGYPACLADAADADNTRTVVPGFVRYATDRRSFLHIDCPGHRPWLKNAARAQGLADVALLVVSAPDSIQSQTHEHLLLARALGVQQVVVFINKCDLVHDFEWIDLIERDLRDLLDRAGFDGNTTRILRGAALPVLSADPTAESPWTATIRDLVEALELDVAIPPRDTTGPPLLYVHAAFNPPQFPRDVVVEGRVRRGRINRQDKLVLLGYGESLDLRIADIEVARAKAEVAEAGERVGLQLHSVDKSLVARAMFAGQALVPRELARASKDLPARIQLLPTREGGRTTSIRAGHKSLLLFGTVVVAATLHPFKNTIVQPGESAEVTLSLVHPVYLEPGMQFALRDGNQGPTWRRGAPAKWAGLSGSGTLLAAPSN